MNNYIKYILILLLFIVGLIIFLCYFVIRSESTLHQFMYPQLYRNKFKDSYFPPSVNKKEYWKRVDKGYNIMKQSKIAILGLAYNLGEDKSYKLIRRLKYITDKFQDHKIIIYCIDSQDDTYHILSNSDLNIEIPLKRIRKDGLTRVQKMSKLRNICSEHLIRSDFNPDYVLVQDCDLASAISIDGLSNSISYLHQKEYDVLFANGLNNNFFFNFHIPYISYTYYDTFAYEPDPENSKLGLNADKAVIHGRGYKPFSVKSAFGGAGLYRYKVFRKYKFDEKNPKLCEHVNLHRQMYEDGYQLGINPSFLVFAGMQGETTHKHYKDGMTNSRAYHWDYDLPISRSYRIF